MRRLLAFGVVAGVVLTAVPAHAQYLLTTGCQTGDWQVIEVSSGGKEYLEVCTDLVKPNVTIALCSLAARLCPPRTGI